MTLLNRLNDDIKTAMKQKDKDTLSVLRLMKSTIQNEEIKTGAPLSDDEELTVLSREMKQRKESLEEFQNAGRLDLVEKVSKELTIVERYLPQQLTQDELRVLIQSAVDEAGATSMKDFGSVMSIVIPKTKGRADGQTVNALVKELIS